MCSFYTRKIGKFVVLHYYLSEEKKSDDRGHFSLGCEDITEYYIRQTKITAWFILIESIL